MKHNESTNRDPGYDSDNGTNTSYFKIINHETDEVSSLIIFLNCTKSSQNTLLVNSTYFQNIKRFLLRRKDDIHVLFL